MGVEGGLCPLRIVRPSGAIKIIYIKFILSQPLRRSVVGRGLVSLSPPFLYVVKVDPSRNKCFSKEFTSPVNPYHVSRESLKCSQTLVT